MAETKQYELSDRLFIMAAVLVGAIVLTYLVGIIVDLKGLPGNEQRYLTVNGQGKIYIVPDIALASFGITEEGTDVPALVAKSNKSMNAIISQIKGLGVDEKDIQTTQYSLTPRYEYPFKTGERVFAGYDMTQTISVKIRNFEKIGDIFNIATTNGANVVNDLYFTVDNPEKAQADARTKAIEQAKEKAQAIAKAAGLKLGKVVSVSDGYYQAYYGNTYDKALGAGEAMSSSVPAPDIQPGQQEVNMTVTVTYKMN